MISAVESTRSLLVLVIINTMISSSYGWFLPSRKTNGTSTTPSNLEFANITLPDDLPVNYPVDAVSQLIQLNPNFYRDIFPAEDLPVTVESRFKDLDENPLCEVNYQLLTPSTLERASDKKPLTIANDYKNGIVQKVRVVHCRNSDTACPFSENFPALYQTHCRQEFSERKLFVYSAEEGKIQSDTFLLPSCCTCQVTRIQ